MYDLKTLEVTEVLHLTADVEALEAGAGSMEEAAQRICRLLYEKLVHGETKEHACVLVRMYRTMRFKELDLLLRGFARSMAKTQGARDAVTDETPCLTLLASVGDVPAWN